MGKYPDESYHFYVPESQAEAENYMYQEKSFIAYCNTLKWLLERDERKELLFLLYRGAHSLSLWYNMSSQGYRSTLVQMMELPPPSSILDRTEMPSAMECPIDVREEVKGGKKVGDLINDDSRDDYTAFRRDTLEMREISDTCERHDPWKVVQE